MEKRKRTDKKVGAEFNVYVIIKMRERCLRRLEEHSGSGIGNRVRLATAFTENMKNDSRNKSRN